MNETAPWTAARIAALKGQQKIACLTAYDYFTARLIDEAGCPLILVGDSLGMATLGYENTLPVTMADMLHHTAAVARGVRRALVVADMPFLSFQVSIPQAIENSGRMLKEAGARAVKIEGGVERAELVKTLVANGIPVLAHIGLTPQSIHTVGGYKVQGRAAEQAEYLLTSAQALQAAGAFAIVVECVPAALARRITEALAIPTIGIGAGSACDGHVLVVNDMLGMQLPGAVTPRFVRRYAEVGEIMRQAFAQYRQDVEDGTYPTPEHEYT